MFNSYDSNMPYIANRQIINEQKITDFSHVYEQVEHVAQQCSRKLNYRINTA